ncbi:MAG: hypothetical protein AAGU15_10105 [Anaerolineaceae bacterium]|jgi:hypothetical protein
MSDEDLRICPNCGQENAAFTLRCIRCGQELEGLFELEGFDSAATPAEEQPDEVVTSAEILNSLENSPLLADADQPVDEEPEGLAEAHEQDNSHLYDPDWLERIRQRAKEEEDATGELAKGTIAMDDQRTQEGRKQVDEAFDEIMRRIREQNEREKVRRSHRIESDLVDENGDPEWLRRIRELHPKQEDDIEESKPSSTKDDLDDEWTEQELQELLRREIGLPEETSDKPGDEITTEINTAEPIDGELEPGQDQPIENSPDQEDETTPEPEFFHNIPEDDQPPIIESEKEQTSQELDVSKTKDAQTPTDDDMNPEEGSAPEETSAEEEPEETEEEKPGAVDKDADGPQETAEEPEDEDEKPELAEVPASTEAVLPDLLMLKAQRERAKVFSDIISQEGRRTIAVLHKTTSTGKLGRLVLGLLLILGVLGAILIGSPGAMELPSVMPAAAFTKNLEAITPEDSVLIVLDYLAATRHDIEPLAEKVLEILKEKGNQPRIVTSNPENLWLAGNILDVSQHPLEYVPGGILGYLASGIRVSPSWGELPMDQAFTGDPDLFAGVDQVILVSDSADFVRTWLEQVSPWRTRMKTSAITTAFSAPILLAYYDSGQLQGVVAGVADGGAFSINQRAFQVGMLLMTVVLLLGMIMKADEDAQKRTEEPEQ